MSTRYCVMADYGSHTVLLALCECEEIAEVVIVQLSDEYRREGRAIHKHLDGSVDCVSRKNRVRLYIEPRSGFTEEFPNG